jgi:hypothetical protein
LCLRHRACHGASSHCGGLFSRNLLPAHPKALLSAMVAIPQLPGRATGKGGREGGVGSPTFMGCYERELREVLTSIGSSLQGQSRRNEMLRRARYTASRVIY